MTRHGRAIHKVDLTGGIDTGIQHSPKFSEYEAASAAGLDLWKWENDLYPVWFKARVLAWHEGHILIESHREDAVAEHMRRHK